MLICLHVIAINTFLLISYGAIAIIVHHSYTNAWSFRYSYPNNVRVIGLLLVIVITLLF